VRENGRVPFDEWLHSFKSQLLQAHVLFRVDQATHGNFGDFASVGQGLMELRIHKGDGYRVYYGLEGDAIILLLAGGDRNSQRQTSKRPSAAGRIGKGAEMKAVPRDVSHYDSLKRELKADPLLALAYFELALQALTSKEESAGGMFALTTLQETFGGLKSLASEAHSGTPIFDTAAEYHDWALQHS
jgi:putative addiction module killer protein